MFAAGLFPALRRDNGFQCLDYPPHAGQAQRTVEHDGGGSVGGEILPATVTPYGPVCYVSNLHGTPPMP